MLFRSLYFDYREFVEEIGRDAWGYIEYKLPLSPVIAKDFELVPEKKIAEYVVYRCPDGSILLDWNENLWKYGYPAYSKQRCTELERGYSVGGTELPKLFAAMRKKYSKEAAE